MFSLFNNGGTKLFITDTTSLFNKFEFTKKFFISFLSA